MAAEAVWVGSSRGGWESNTVEERDERVRSALGVTCARVTNDQFPCILCVCWNGRERPLVRGLRETRLSTIQEF